MPIRHLTGKDRAKLRNKRDNANRQRKNALKTKANEIKAIVGSARGERFAENFYCAVCNQPSRVGYFYKGRTFEYSVCLSCNNLVKPKKQYVQMISTPMGGKV